jgi:hypothetical protein
MSVNAIITYASSIQSNAYCSQSHRALFQKTFERHQKILTLAIRGCVAAILR